MSIDAMLARHVLLDRRGEPGQHLRNGHGREAFPPAAAAGPLPLVGLRSAWVKREVVRRRRDRAEPFDPGQQSRDPVTGGVVAAQRLDPQLAGAVVDTFGQQPRDGLLFGIEHPALAGPRSARSTTGISARGTMSAASASRTGPVGRSCACAGHFTPASGACSRPPSGNCRSVARRRRTAAISRPSAAASRRCPARCARPRPARPAATVNRGRKAAATASTSTAPSLLKARDVPLMAHLSVGRMTDDRGADYRHLWLTERSTSCCATKCPCRGRRLLGVFILIGYRRV